MNPHGCGFFGDGQRECRCSTTQVQKYRQRISGPLLDRIDLHVEAPAVRFKEMASPETSEPSAAILQRVEAARQVQATRFTNSATGCNARMTPKQIKAHCALSTDAQELLKMAMTQLPTQRPRLRPHPQSLPHHRRPRPLRAHHHRPHQRSHPIPHAGSKSVVGYKPIVNASKLLPLA
ncbi:MAG: ATP-binding protein [Chthoniobacteraceae bacterium]